MTGSRDWGDGQLIWSVLDIHKPDLVIHGACPTGADSIADAWTIATGTTCIPMPARWKAWGKKMGGPMRNRAMCEVAERLAEYGHEVVVCAFPLPDSRGTVNCMREAKARFLKVEVHGS